MQCFYFTSAVAPLRVFPTVAGVITRNPFFIHIKWLLLVITPTAARAARNDFPPLRVFSPATLYKFFSLQPNSIAVTPTIWYCYDAYCGWCYGFSPAIKKLYESHKDQLAFDVLSGGMILNEQPPHISRMAAYIGEAYQQVEQLTGIRFGEDFLWHIQNPDKSDWYPDSLKPAISLCVFKKYFPHRAVEWAADLQVALNYEGRDLTDDEAYRHLTEKYDLPTETFYELLHSESYREQALYEFQLIKQLQVTGFPCVLVQVSDSKFYMIARGFTPYDLLEERLEKVLEENKP